ncbi:MAG: hypothetical protein CME15_06885 [Gemmatimonadetes bacterium]|jgi:UDP-GlcNAc:undecaprenyl-phosphate GlcNAc-1-phosphate transferase|nr:hypothetical protein [Gemmatimonadota bacterium]
MLAADRYLLAGAAFVLSVGGTFTIRALALRLGFVNQPNPIIPQHTLPVAYAGGVGLFIGVVIALAGWILGGYGAPAVLSCGEASAYLLPAALFLVMGLYDDLRSLGTAAKFAFQGLIGAVAVGLGVDVQITGIAPVDSFLSWFTLLTFVNAFNLVDVCDGLLASISVVVFAFLAHLVPSASWIAIPAAGACLGFLLFNRPPATIFLGDAGSQTLGYLAGAVILLGGRTGGAEPWLVLVQGFLVASVPLFEVAFLVVVRRRKGLAWWRGSPDHFSLRLQKAGLSPLQTDLVSVAVCLAVGTLGLILGRISGAGCGVVVLAAGLLFASFWVTLLRYEVEPEEAG